MGYIPTIEQAAALLAKYNKEAFHIRHAQVVSGVMGWFANKYGEDAAYWSAVGYLHDLDFELYPDEHCVKTKQLMLDEGLDGAFIYSCVSHGWGMTGTDAKPEKRMEKVLFAVDELTGLIGAAALIRPSGSVSDMEPKSVLKKYKTPAFAAGCSRGVIAEGAQMLGVALEELVADTLEAMKTLVGTVEGV